MPALIPTDHYGVVTWPGDAAAFSGEPRKLPVGMRLRLHVPDQPVWTHLDAVRKASTS